MPSPARPRGRLLRKYVVFFVALVTGALLASGLVEIYFSYQENKAALAALQREKALAAASRIGGFIKEVERQIEWTTQAGGSTIEQRRFDYIRLQRQAEAITEIGYLDKTGREQLRISRLAMDVVGSQEDFSQKPRFREARAGHAYHSPVYFRKDSEPYITIAIGGPGQDAGVTVAEVNLKFLWEVVSQIKIGKAGHAYVVDSSGQLLAHPDISRVLQKTDLSGLQQVRAALAAPARPGDAGEAATTAHDLHGKQVLTAFAPVAPLGWAVFVEQPLVEAYEPLYSSMYRTAGLIVFGIVLSVVASLFLARRMVTPIKALEAGAARIGAGELGHRIDVRTGDELEALAAQVNETAGRLQESYATLEQKVDERTRELSESLEQQVATGEVLRVISGSPRDLTPVFDAILENATRLCEAELGVLFRYDGEVVQAVACRGLSPEAEAEYRAPRRPTPTSGVGRAVFEKRPVHIPDIVEDDAYRANDPLRLRTVRFLGARTMAWVPLLKEGHPVGALAVFRREVRPFGDKQIALVQTFADQAVIAIENVRLFQELESRNHDLTEALEQQTATAEILRVITSSPSDLQPVYRSILTSVMRLCEAGIAVLFTYDGRVLTTAAHEGTSPEFAAHLERGPRTPSHETTTRLAARERRTVHVPDLLADPTFAPTPIELYRNENVRTVLSVPLLRESTLVGVITTWRREVRPFTDKQVALVSTFADQAVIAIENTRLFQELQARVEELRALGEVSQAVGSSLDLGRVLDAVAGHAVKLSAADAGGIFEIDPERQAFVPVTAHGLSEAFIASLRATRIDLRAGTIGRASESGQPTQIADVAQAPGYPLRDALLAEGYHAVLALPMGDEHVTRGMVLMRRAAGEFDERVVSLLGAIASQSKVAIENARLFREVEDKGRELEVANRHKSEFLANMSHELRTPLNAIIGFSEVLLDRMFGEINEKQAEYLQDVLSSGRHLLSLINDILDLSKVEAGRMELDLAPFDLPTALDNALTLVRERAGRHGIRLVLAVSPGVGELVGDERKVKQILLNLLSNAVKFTPEGGQVSVSATLANGSVEISVADTGIGIAPEDQEAIFEEFRQVGTDYARKREGTGLGLPLARRFVELHGGALWVKSEPGTGSTFTFSLPLRAAADAGHAAG